MLVRFSRVFSVHSFFLFKWSVFLFWCLLDAPTCYRYIQYTMKPLLFNLWIIRKEHSNWLNLLLSWATEKSTVHIKIHKEFYASDGNMCKNPISEIQSLYIFLSSLFFFLEIIIEFKNVQQWSEFEVKATATSQCRYWFLWHR